MKNKHTYTPLFLSLFISLIYIVSLSTSQTQADAPSWGGAVVTQGDYQGLKVVHTYSDEIDFRSAEEYSNKIIEYKDEYKKVFIKKLQSQLYNIPTSKLEIISERINVLMEGLEKKSDNGGYIDKKIAQLLALKEIIETILEEDNEFTIDSEIEELLKI